MNDVNLFDYFGINYNLKPIIWHLGLSRVYTECPYCKMENPEDEKGYCLSCNKKIDLSNPIYIKTKDYIEVEKAGLSGAVYKDAKGVWHEKN